MTGNHQSRDFLRRCVCRGTFAVSCLLAWGGGAHAGMCSAPWPEVKPVLESAIGYGDATKKSDPFVTLTTRGRRVRLLLDTGSNAHVIWDKRLLADPAAESGNADTSRQSDARADGAEAGETLHAIASSTHARPAALDLVDMQGNRVTQQFYVIDATPLMADGFSGILSPQYLAQEKVSIIDFKRDCFFVSERFDPEANGQFSLSSGGTLPNPYRVMAIPLGVAGARVPVVVDSGAPFTKLLAAVIERSPAGPRLPMNIDLLGNPIASDERTRLVDLTINGETVKRHPVMTAATLSDKGIVSMGAIGMDLLRDRVLFHDDDRHRFVFLEQ
ncbi:hypothetical protein ACPWR0_08865 [Pandoraea pneumonica]|uniref:hypothetical protein n=1 Tax=Pandoraea pneumonica TaxID=2508299 RepID=UPI003CEA7DC2